MQDDHENSSTIDMRYNRRISNSNKTKEEITVENTSSDVSFDNKEFTQSNKTNERLENVTNSHDYKNKTDQETSIFSRFYLKYIEFCNDVYPYLITINSLLISNFIDFHTILKEKLHIPYPLDLIIFSLIGYCICIVILRIICKVKIS